MFNNKRIRKLEKKMNEYEKDNSLENKLSELAKKMSEYEKLIEKYEKMYEDYKSISMEKELAKNSDEPWAGFSIVDVNKDGQVGIELDWNEPFIEHLKKNGIQASSEEEMVSVLFASLMKEMGDEVSEEEAKKYREVYKT